MKAPSRDITEAGGLTHDAEPIGPPPEALAFYRRVLESLAAAGVEVLVGGAYAFAAYTGIERHTKDLDVFLRRGDYERASRALAAAGFETELTHPHWLGKVRSGEHFVDLIFNSGNGVTEVDDEWFAFAPAAEVLGLQARIMPVEEMLWSKSFVMERERYDGADLAHLLRARAGTLDWPRLLRRFGPHWRVLLSHLVLFGFIYPAERTMVPVPVMDELLERLRAECGTAAIGDERCQGTLLSREQYLHDVERKGYEDGRSASSSKMTEEDIAAWTRAIGEKDGDPERPGAS